MKKLTGMICHKAKRQRRRWRLIWIIPLLSSIAFTSLSIIVLKGRQSHLTENHLTENDLINDQMSKDKIENEIHSTSFVHSHKVISNVIRKNGSSQFVDSEELSHVLRKFNSKQNIAISKKQIISKHHQQNISESKKAQNTARYLPQTKHENELYFFPTSTEKISSAKFLEEYNKDASNTKNKNQDEIHMAKENDYQSPSKSEKTLESQLKVNLITNENFPIPPSKTSESRIHSKENPTTHSDIKSNMVTGNEIQKKRNIANPTPNDINKTRQSRYFTTHLPIKFNSKTKMLRQQEVYSYDSSHIENMSQPHGMLVNHSQVNLNITSENKKKFPKTEFFSTKSPIKINATIKDGEIFRNEKVSKIQFPLEANLSTEPDNRSQSKKTLQNYDSGILSGNLKGALRFQSNGTDQQRLSEGAFFVNQSTIRYDENNTPGTKSKSSIFIPTKHQGVPMVQRLQEKSNFKFSPVKFARPIFNRFIKRGNVTKHLLNKFEKPIGNKYQGEKVLANSTINVRLTKVGRYQGEKFERNNPIELRMTTVEKLLERKTKENEKKIRQANKERIRRENEERIRREREERIQKENDERIRRENEERIAKENEKQKLLYNNPKEMLRGDSCNNCFKNDFHIHINQERICGNSLAIDVIILITSSPKDLVKRIAIRKTWGSNCNNDKTNIKCVFILGTSGKVTRHNKRMSLDQQLLKESSNFKDIVQFDFADSYGNLTYKTLSGLRWVANFCPNAKYIMKTDTDMFVNTELLPLLLRGAPNNSFVGGVCTAYGSPNRDSSSKWFASYKTYKHQSYPPWCSGTGYIMSHDVVKSILKMSPNVPFFHLEDIYIALCLKEIGILPKKLKGFYNWLAGPLDACFYKNNVITSHELTPEMLYQYWAEMWLCDGEFQQNVYQVLSLY